jgi:hypothetical protein
MTTANGAKVDLEGEQGAKANLSQMPVYKLGLMNAFLFAAARRGDVVTAERLLSHNVVQAQVRWAGGSG